MAPHLPEAMNCPICGKHPDIDVVAPWPRGNGAPPWYAVCYRQTPYEHCVGVNGDDRREVIKNWNKEVEPKAQ